MEAPILQITVLKGPRNGEILVCNPDSPIQIGRIMKGNSLALRDPAVSQNHLCFRFIQDDFRWFVSDLNTSNGTTINGSKIQTSKLVSISDGDVIEIGLKTKLGVKIVTPRVLEGKTDGNNVRGRRVTRRGASLSVNSSRVSGGLKGAQSKVSAPVRGRRNNVRPVSTVVQDKEEEEALNPDLVSDSGVELGQKGTVRRRGDIVTMNTARVLEKEESRDSVMFSHLETEESDPNGEAKVRRNPRRVKSSRVLKEVDGNCAVDSVLEVKQVGMKRKGMGGGRSITSTVSEEEKENGDNLVLKLDGPSSDPDHVAIPELRKGIKVKTSADSSMVIEEEGEEDAGVEEIGLKGAQSKVSAPVRGRRNNVRPISTMVSDKEEVEALNPDLVSYSGVEMGQKETEKGKGDIIARNTARVLEKEGSRDSVTFSHLETEESDHNREGKVRRNPRRVKSSRVLKEVDGNCAVDSVLGVKEVGMKRKGMGGGRDTASTVSEEEKENDDNLVLKLDSPSSDLDHVAIPELRKGIKARISADSSMAIEEEGEEDVGVEEGERNSEEARVDFEKNTLDEWFDNMEFFLPMVIREESEKIIGILKEKARKFDELLEVGTDAA